MKVARMAANSDERKAVEMDTTTVEKKVERMADKTDDAKVDLLRRRRVKEENGNKV